jgi:arabinose-5-phosphate isomerase
MTRGRTCSTPRGGRHDHAPVTVRGQMLAVEALRLLEERKITAVVVVSDDGTVEGVVHLHDLWRTQMF